MTRRIRREDEGGLRPAAKRMMMTARVVEADEAGALGLGELLANGAFSNSATKRLLMETDGVSLAERLAYEHYHHPGRAPDWRERVDRFRRG
jgi:hypothetical protein